MSKNAWIRWWELLALLGMGAALFFALDVRGTIARWQQYERRIRVLEQQNAALAGQNRQQREYLEKLRNDPREQERRLRKERKQVRPGDMVFTPPEQPR